MKICGVIAEYNPFHNGHRLQLTNAIEKTNADICIVIMSGMFTQRGDIAIVPKFLRTQMALSQGADLVIELPVCYVLQPAEYFALGGVGILNALGVDYISYGTEAFSEYDRKVIDSFVTMTNSPSDEFELQIKNSLKEGVAYPQARALAFKKITASEDISILKRPNAILEIAYKNAIHRLNSNLIPIPVPRVGDDYHEIYPKSKIASATATRNLIHSKKEYMDFLPSQCSSLISSYLSENKAAHINMLYPYLMHTLTVSQDTLKLLPDVNEEIYNRMLNSAKTSYSTDEYISNVSTKRFSSARISRAVMHSILNISEDLISSIRTNIPLYARVLGVKKGKNEVLGILSKQASIPLFTSVANPNLTTNLQKALLKHDIAATNLYNFTINRPELYNQDYTQKLIIC